MQRVAELGPLAERVQLQACRPYRVRWELAQRGAGAGARDCSALRLAGARVRGDSACMFSVSVLQGAVPGWSAEHAASLLGRISVLRNAGPGMVASNRGAFHSARDFHRADDFATHWMRDAICAFARDTLGSWMAATGTVRFGITECWAIAAGPGGYLVPHTHFPAPWSGVLYLDAEHVAAVPDGGGELVLFCPVPVAQVFHMPPTVELAPKNGHIVLFPGALQHGVNPHRASSTRYSVAFNLMGFGPRVDGKT